MQRPGSTTIRSLGGLHKMYGWEGGIITDSGGFQAYSLIHANPKNGSITDRGLLFRSEAKNDRLLLTPEKTIQLQLNFGSDLVICLDDCTHPDAPYDDQTRAVDRTIAWAKKCKAEYLRLIDSKKISYEARPRIFAVIQGGKSNSSEKNAQRLYSKLVLTGLVTAVGRSTRKSRYSKNNSSCCGPSSRPYTHCMLLVLVIRTISSKPVLLVGRFLIAPCRRATPGEVVYMHSNIYHRQQVTWNRKTGSKRFISPIKIK